MAYRIREMCDRYIPGFGSGPVEVDETYVGRKEKNRHCGKHFNAGRGGVG